MSLSLRHSKAAADMAELLYDFLPGSGSATWKGHVTFGTVADKVGVGDFWPGGSKQRALTVLLERTLEYRRGRFQALILEIVRAGITYRQKKKNSITPEEIDRLNGLILEVDFKFPDLWDSDFKAMLAVDGEERAKAHVEQALTEERLEETQREARVLQLEDLKRKFFELHSQADRQNAGLQFESVLNNLFNLSGLSPREPFRLTGEQIDGSFSLENEVYLLEAKWQKKPSPEADLLVFRGKVTGKSRYTRGVFVSVNGVSEEAKASINEGKERVFFVMDDFDLTMILEGAIALDAFLRQRQRLLAEEGAVVVPYNELFAGNRTRA